MRHRVNSHFQVPPPRRARTQRSSFYTTYSFFGRLEPSITQLQTDPAHYLTPYRLSDSPTATYRSEPCRVTALKNNKVVTQSVWHKDLVYEAPLSEVMKIARIPVDLRGMP